jgi:hypothetical protein
MRLRRSAPLLFLFLVVGCSTTRVVRLETGQRNAVTFTPRGDIASVDLSEEQYKGAVKGLAREAQPSYRALQDARWLFRDSLGARAEGRLGLVSVGPPRRNHLLSEKPSADSQLVGAYVRWCARRNLTGDCLHLMGGGSSLDEDGKRALAFRFAVDSVWEETSEALEDMTDREALVSMLASTGAVYLGLWLLPEPVSKGVAAVLTLGLVAWLGWDTVWSLIEGWRVLNDEVRVATTFDQLQAAGEKYGEVMGAQAARAFLMLAMAVLGSSAELAASRMATLPGAHQASLVAAGQGRAAFGCPPSARLAPSRWRPMGRSRSRCPRRRWPCQRRLEELPPGPLGTTLPPTRTRSPTSAEDPGRQGSRESSTELGCRSTMRRISSRSRRIKGHIPRRITGRSSSGWMT